MDYETVEVTLTLEEVTHIGDQLRTHPDQSHLKLNESIIRKLLGIELD